MTHQHTHHGPNDPQVHRITEARESHTVERDSRVRKYTITMTVRVVCFILAFFAQGWLQWALLIGAIFLPYIAVVIANGGTDVTKREPPAEFYTGPAQQRLTAGTGMTPPAGDEVIDGTLADDAPSTDAPAADETNTTPGEASAPGETEK